MVQYIDHSWGFCGWVIIQQRRPLSNIFLMPSRWEWVYFVLLHANFWCFLNISILFNKVCLPRVLRHFGGLTPALCVWRSVQLFIFLEANFQCVCFIFLLPGPTAFTAVLQSISFYSNTISHVEPRSHDKLLFNYQHNHIWLLIVCVLVSFQKVPQLAGCARDGFLLHDSEGESFFFFYWGTILRSVCAFSLFLTAFPPLCLRINSLVVWMILQANHKSCNCEHNWERVRQSAAAVSAYLFIPHTKHTGFKPLNIQTVTPDILSLSACMVKY